MKGRIVFFISILAMVSLTAQAQSTDFDLYFANNITDVANLNQETIEESDNGLIWTKVNKETVNVYGNHVEVNKVKEMFASTQMKNLTEQQQFWRMRDHSLVCFRINDGKGTYGSFGVEVDDGYGTKLNLTVSKFFYANIPLQYKPLSFKVWKVDAASDTIRFKYESDDWNDDHLYVFQLDSKRQVTGETYVLEYDLSYADDNGELQEEKHYLDIANRSFQSFYVPEDRTLADIFLMSGNPETTPQTDLKKLRINRRRLHTGVTPYNKFYNLTLSPRFELDKHENRELVNFNWIGTGLYEKFDTLYIKLKKANNDDVRSAQMNVAQVDKEGNEVVNGAIVKYCGWDEGRKAHKVLTNGNPAYIEILPPQNNSSFFPMMLKYRGSTDPLTNIVDEERCSAEAVVVEGNVRTADFALSNQHFHGLHDGKSIIMYRGEEHALCILDDLDLAGRATTDIVEFSNDGCQAGKKLMNGLPIEQLGELVLTFSEPKGSTTDITVPRIEVSDAENGTTLSTLTANAHAQAYSISKFTRNYYDVCYDLTSLKENTQCRLVLKTDNKTYDKLPYFRRFVFVRDDNEEVVDDYVNDLVDNSTKDDPTKEVGGTNSDFNAEWAIPINFKWDSPVSGLSISSSFYFNLSKKVVNFLISADYRRQSKDTDEDGWPDGSRVSKMRQDIYEYRNWDNIRDYSPANSADLRNYEVMSDHGFTGGMVSTSAQQKLDNWVFSEFDDIFSLPTPGFNVSGGLKCAGMITQLGKWTKEEQEKYPRVPVITDLSLYFKLAYGAFVPNALERLGRKLLGKPGETLFKYGSWLSMNAVAEASFEVSGSYKNYTADSLGWSSGGHGLLISATAKVRGGISAEIHSPPNPVLHVGAGVRAGAKLGLGGAFGTDFHGHNDVGGMLTALLGVEAYAYIRSLAGTLNAATEVHLGNRFLIGPQDDHNPFHKDYPYWAPKPDKKSNTNRIRRAEHTLPEVVYGNELVTGLNSTANPHYLDANSVVYNDPASPDDYNDDRIALLNTADNTTTTLSADGVRAANHMRSKRGDHEIVVYEEMTRSIESSEMNNGDDIDKASELSTQQRIVANIRTAGGEWKRSVVSDAMDITDAKPIVTMQDDGHAACVWLRGNVKKNEEATASSDGDDDNSGDFFNTYLDGQMVLSIYDGNTWSTPVNLFSVGKDNVAKQYDLFMRNDTVLVGANFTKSFYDDSRRTTQFTYASVPLSTKTPSYVEESLHPMRFFMNRVGEHAVIALLYEKNDTLSDIYVKTLAMNGHDDGRTGNDLGARFCSPRQVKIICDRHADDLSDFAVLWTEMSNTVHGEDATAAGNGQARMILNASRVAVQRAISVTSPLTMGAEKEGMLMTDFDGFLDDQHIKVVYSLTDVEDETAVIMENERYFTNSFRFDVDYTKEALLGSSTLPVSITIANTGTSAIRHATATINGKEFSIDDSRVQPLSVKEFIVNYPIDASFNGYLETSVQVEYDNVFRAKRHAVRRNLSLTSQTSTSVKSHAAMEDVEMRLIGQSIEEGVNTFGVELIDRSVNGLSDDSELHVGLFASPLLSSLLSTGAKTVVRASDFVEFGGVRKAYAKVQVSGIAETTNALLNLFVVRKVNDNGKETETLIDNVHATDNAHYVYLQPSNNPTDINPVKFQETKSRLAVKVTAEAGGVRISGLPTGSDAEGHPYHVRIYNAAGMGMYSQPVTSESIFVPLSQHGVYVLSTGKDILKFQY